MSVIDPDNDTGTDYLSLAAFITGEAGDQAGGAVLAEFRASSGSADSTNTVFTGFSNYSSFDVQPHADNVNHSGIYTTSGYRIERASYQALMNVQQDGMVIDGMQIFMLESTYDSRKGIHINTMPASSSVTVKNTIIKTEDITNTQFKGLAVDDADVTVTAENLLIYDFGGTNNYGAHTNAGTLNLYNSTIIDCTVGCRAYSGTTKVVNVLTNGCTDGFSGTFTSSDYNLSDITSDAPGGNSVTSTLTFVDAANDDYHLASTDTDAIGAGIGPSSDANVPTLDVDGDTRSGTTTDIGFDLYVAAGGGRIMSSLVCAGGLAGHGGLAGEGGGLAG